MQSFRIWISWTIVPELSHLAVVVTPVPPENSFILEGRIV